MYTHSNKTHTSFLYLDNILNNVIQKVIHTQYVYFVSYKIISNIVLSDTTKWNETRIYTNELPWSDHRDGRSMPCLCLSESILGAWTTIGVRFASREETSGKRNRRLSSNSSHKGNCFFSLLSFIENTTIKKFKYLTLYTIYIYLTT